MVYFKSFCDLISLNNISLASHRKEDKHDNNEELTSEMSHDTSWDIEALRSPHEPQHQWELRRSFMEKHKSDFPKDKLVCLAQTLANMEFMGCHYPQDTMDQVYIE